MGPCVPMVDSPSDTALARWLLGSAGSPEAPLRSGLLDVAAVGAAEGGCVEETSGAWEPVAAAEAEAATGGDWVSSSSADGLANGVVCAVDKVKLLICSALETEPWGVMGSSKRSGSTMAGPPSSRVSVPPAANAHSCPCCAAAPCSVTCCTAAAAAPTAPPARAARAAAPARLRCAAAVAFAPPSAGVAMPSNDTDAVADPDENTADASWSCICPPATFCAP